mmetsp:Transcript_64325/g.94200  ORF Transcript_64325/g.94200 Transcript_64325/m.94200 type:complete len:209 (-) Transcript_64325:120-746(-)
MFLYVLGNSKLPFSAFLHPLLLVLFGCFDNSAVLRKPFQCQIGKGLRTAHVRKNILFIFNFCHKIGNRLFERVETLSRFATDSPCEENTRSRDAMPSETLQILQMYFRNGLCCLLHLFHLRMVLNKVGFGRANTRDRRSIQLCTSSGRPMCTFKCILIKKFEFVVAIVTQCNPLSTERSIALDIVLKYHFKFPHCRVYGFCLTVHLLP